MPTFNFCLLLPIFVVDKQRAPKSSCRRRPVTKVRDTSSFNCEVNNSYHSYGDRKSFVGDPVEDTMNMSSEYQPPKYVYQIIKGVSQKGKEMLFNLRGHRFEKHNNSKHTWIWRCTCRAGVDFPLCNAKVYQQKKNEDFLDRYEQQDFKFKPKS